MTAGSVIVWGCVSPADVHGLADGGRTFEVRAIDLAQNPDPTPAAWDWRVDTRAPVATVLRTDAAGGRSPRFAFTADEAASFECRLGGGGWTPCASGFGYDNVPAGTHTFVVRATDGVGNRVEDGQSLTFSVTAPAAATGTTGTGTPAGAASPRPAAGMSIPVPAPGTDAASTLAAAIAGDVASLLRRTSRRRLRADGLRVPVAVHRKGTVRITVTMKRDGRTVVAARGSLTFSAPASKRVAVRLTDAGRRTLKGTGKVTLTVRAEAAGAEATAKAKV